VPARPIPPSNRPLQAGDLVLPNRILMAPLTRCRAEPDHVPGALMATHYAQRASAGLLIAEATMAMEGNSAFWHEPGIHSPPRWRLEERHRRGAQGRRTHLPAGLARRPRLPPAAQRRRPARRPQRPAIRNDEVHTPEGKKPYVTPRALADDELPGIVAGFRHAAENALAAGFDGVEVHGANGYLLDEFLRDGSNTRSGPYGGPIENRARLLLEVLDACVGVWGAAASACACRPSTATTTWSTATRWGLMEWPGASTTTARLPAPDARRLLRPAEGRRADPGPGPLQGRADRQHGLHPARGRQRHRKRPARRRRLRHRLPRQPRPARPHPPQGQLNTPDPATFYTPGSKGYTDYPTLAQSA
jgi:N-ethylmaleimide reductase